MSASKSVLLAPLIWGIPKEPVRKSETFTIELGLRVDGEWTYPQDSFEISVMAVGRNGLAVFFNNGGSFIVHRDPEACTRLALTVVAEAAGTGLIVVDLITQGGIPFRNFAFEVVVVDKTNEPTRV